MASQRSNTFQVGLFMIASVALAFGVLLWISTRVGGAMQPIIIHFDSTPDMPVLSPGSEILVGGQKVGRVTDTKLTREEKAAQAPHYTVVVQAEIAKDLELRKDCQAIAEGPPLGGAGLIKISLGEAAQAYDILQPIQGGTPGGLGAILTNIREELDGDNPQGLLGRVKTQLNPDMQGSLMAKLLQSADDIAAITGSLKGELTSEQRVALLEKLHQVLDNVNQTTASLRDEFDPDKPEVLLARVRGTLEKLQEASESVRRILATNEPRIDNTVASVEKAAASLAVEMNSANPDSLLAHIKSGGKRLDDSLADIQAITGSAREVVVLNQSNINRMLLNFKETSDHIKTGVKYVLQHPWKLLNTPTDEEARQQAVIDTAREFAEAAARIDDAAARLSALAELHDGVIPADDADLKQIQTILSATREKYQAAEARLWERLDVP